VSTHEAVDASGGADTDPDVGGVGDDVAVERFDCDDDESDDPPPHAAANATKAPAPRRPRASRRETGAVIGSCWQVVAVRSLCRHPRLSGPACG
jgi:hypothetical protein